MSERRISIIVLFADPCSPIAASTGYGPVSRSAARTQAMTKTKSSSALTLMKSRNSLHPAKRSRSKQARKSYFSKHLIFAASIKFASRRGDFKRRFPMPKGPYPEYDAIHGPGTWPFQRILSRLILKDAGLKHFYHFSRPA